MQVTRDADGTLHVAVTVTNTGKRAGREVVQVYVRDRRPVMEKPDRELKGFAKTSLLEPGESETLDIRIAPYILASFNEGRGSWELPTAITVFAGASVEDLRLSRDLD